MDVSRFLGKQETDDLLNRIVRMPFGKYKGCELKDVPSQYYEWFFENMDLSKEFIRSVKEYWRWQRSLR